MAATSVQRFYRYHAAVYDSTRWMILHGRRRAVQRLELRPDSRVLEVGCGTGLNFAYILERLDPQRGRLVGLDFSADMLEKAQARCQRRGWSQVELLQADATQLEMHQTFDAILFAYSLTMIPDWPAALQRARTHLAPGGRLVVLDFGRFDAWGPLAPLMRTWLGANHVDTRQPYVAELARIFGTVEATQWAGGYNFTALVRRPADA